jgi:hypothetical protein
MVCNDRPVYQEEHAAQLIMARRETALHLKAEYIGADLSIDPSLFPCSRAADHTFAGPKMPNGLADQRDYFRVADNPPPGTRTVWLLDERIALS